MRSWQCYQSFHVIPEHLQSRKRWSDDKPAQRMTDKWQFEILPEVVLINELLDLHWQFSAHFLHVLIDHWLIASRVQNKNIFTIQILEKSLKLTERTWSSPKPMHKHHNVRLINIQRIFFSNLQGFVKSDLNWRVEYFQICHINSFELVVNTFVMEELLQVVLGNFVLCKWAVLWNLRASKTILVRRAEGQLLRWNLWTGYVGFLNTVLYSLFELQPQFLVKLSFGLVHQWIISYLEKKLPQNQKFLSHFRNEPLNKFL